MSDHLRDATVHDKDSLRGEEGKRLFVGTAESFIGGCGGSRGNPVGAGEWG
jgi:hypothetical protein